MRDTCTRHDTSFQLEDILVFLSHLPPGTQIGKYVEHFSIDLRVFPSGVLSLTCSPSGKLRISATRRRLILLPLCPPRPPSTSPV